MRYWSMAFACAVLLAGCANWTAHQKAQEMEYIGRPVENMYDEYGVPVGVAPLLDGGKFIEFQYFQGIYECNAKVKTDAKLLVVEIRTGGQNGCII